LRGRIEKENVLAGEDERNRVRVETS
jgi:hypothetical protein